VAGEEQDSDEDNTDDEDEYDVDFSENFWQSREQLRQMVDQLGEDEVLDDYDDDAVPAEVTTGLPQLQDCKVFEFAELTPEQAANMSSAQKLYEAESGLWRGVATSFATPLEASGQVSLNG
jgi:hypothetical protein